MLGKSLKRRTSTTESEQMDQLVAALEQAAALAQAGVPTQQVWEQLETCQQLNHGVWGSASKAARQLVEQAGASASDLLNDLAVTAMQYQEAADSRNAALAGPQATARTLAWLPLVGLGLGALLGAQPWQVLTDAGIGSLAGLVGLGLLLIGRWWTRQMIRKATFAVPVDDVLAVDLCAAALRAGLALPAALEAAGRASGGALAQYLAASGRQLA
ncbi:MAG: hypothetical protein LBG70_00705, partial [Bifidobacteriaceae bacterium]|nr:hypothetical protein [Bifidobacteriaceae bacterium]